MSAITKEKRPGGVPGLFVGGSHCRDAPFFSDFQQEQVWPVLADQVKLRPVYISAVLLHRVPQVPQLVSNTVVDNLVANTHDQATKKVGVDPERYFVYVQDVAYALLLRIG